MWCVLALGQGRTQVIGPFPTAQDAARFASDTLTKPAWAVALVATPMEDPAKYGPDGPK